MMTEHPYLSLVECKNQLEMIDLMLDRTRRLPEMIFQRKMRHFSFFEFDYMIGSEFMPILRSTIEHFRDDSLTITVLDPDPLEYFFHEFGHCGAFRIKATTTGDEYFDILAHEPPDSPADALLYNSNIITWTSPGNKWAMWGERDSGIGVLGAESDPGFISSVTGLLTAQLAAELAAISLNLQNTMASNYKAMLLRNYSAIARY